MSSVVLIPQDYESLSYAEQEQTIPICIGTLDRRGQPIAAEWFVDGVAPARKQLIRTAYCVLGDAWCVSELAEVTVNRLWERYGNNVGFAPARRVLRKAIHVALELRAGDWRKLKYPKLYVALDALDEGIRDRMLSDPCEFAALFEQQVMLDSVDTRLEGQGLTEMQLVYRLLRRGYSWTEVAENVGNTNADTLKHRFYRWAKAMYRR